MSAEATVRHKLLAISASAAEVRLARRLRLVRHEPAVRRLTLFRNERYDLSQASPLYWMSLQLRGDPNSEQYLAPLDAMDEVFSPTYIVVDIVAANILAMATAAREVRALAGRLEHHFLRHLARHCDFSGHCWIGPYSRAYAADVDQSDSLLNLFLYRVTGDAGWLRGDFRSGGEWGAVLSMLRFPPVGARRRRRGELVRERALSHPRSRHEQRRCTLTLYHGGRFQLASADAYREWEQAHPLTVHCGDVTVAYRSLTMGHFLCSQEGGLVLGCSRPVCTLHAEGRDDMLQNVLSRAGFEFVCSPRHGCVSVAEP